MKYESYYDQLTASQQPAQATMPVQCPTGSRWNAALSACIPDDRPATFRRETGVAMPRAIEPVPLPMAASGPQTMGDALGTVKSVGMGILNVLTLVGAIGGLAYIWSNRGNIFHTWSRPGYWKGRRAARRGR